MAQKDPAQEDRRVRVPMLHTLRGEGLLARPAVRARSGDTAAQRHADTEIGTLTAAFERMLPNVEQSLPARQASEDRLRQFLSDASHELRAPDA